MIRQARWFVWLILLLPLLAQAAVQATLDRQVVQLGETVTLNLHAENSGPLAAPDLSALSSDFAVLSQSSGQTMSFINGQRKMEFNIGIALRPLHQGDLRIPPLQVGGETTQPLTLHVTAPDPAAAANANRPVFLEASVDPPKAYVGQQISLSVKLYFLANLANASLADPRIDGVDVSRIGGDMDYQAERNGRTYNVIERRYVLVPQQAGELKIPPVQFQGDLLDPNDPDSFLGMGAPVSAVSAPLQVQVLPAPADWGKAAWLPARKLTLSLEGLPGNGTPLRVGQPFNLGMTLEATGIPFEALPALSLPDLRGATAYPDKPVTGNRTDGPWVVGRRQQEFAVVPDKAGTLTIPAITLKWWNVLADKAESATVPAHTYTVQPAAGTVVNTAPPAPAAATSTTEAASSPSLPAEAASALAGRHSIWVWIALGSLGLWLLSGLVWLVWWLRRRRSRPGSASRISPPATPVASARQLQKAFVAAAKGHDTDIQANTLLAWARSERPDLVHLESLAAALASPRQHEAIAALQRQRYAAGESAPAGPLLLEAFAKGFVWRSNVSTPGEDEPLPPLYPFKLH